MNDGSLNAVGATPMNRRTLLRRAGLAAGTIAVGGAGALGYRAYVCVGTHIRVPQ
jgi:hypothetical protein